MKLSRTEQDRYAETLGDTAASAEEMEEARRIAAQMGADRHPVDDDEAFRDFEDTWGPVLQEDEVFRLKRVIKQMPLLEQCSLPEDEQYRLLAVVALKLGLHDASEFLRACITTGDKDLAEIEEALSNL